MKHTLQIHMTDKCNLKCEYCYIKQSQNIMTFETLKYQINEVERLSNLLDGKKQHEYDITYFGGEPLLEIDNVLKFDEYICSNLSIVHKFMQTNGILLDKRIKRLLDKKHINIGISCDGCNDPNKEYVEKIYRDKLVDMQPKMMIDGKNIYHLMDNIKYFFELAVTSQQLNFYIDVSFVRDKGVWGEKSLNELKKQLKELKNFIIWCYNTYNYYLKIGFIDRILQNIVQGKRDYICFAGKNGFSLTPSGTIFPCSRFYSNQKYPLCNVYENIIFYENIELIKKKNTTIDKNCKDCVLEKYCNQGCFYSQIENGGIVKEYCEVQKIAFNMVSELYKNFKNFYNIDITKVR